MSTTPEKLWTDPSIDPGPSDATPPNRKSAARSVLAAIRAGALSDLPPELVAAPDALARFEAFERAAITGTQAESPSQLVARYAQALVTGEDVDPAAFGSDVRTAAQVAATADALPYSLASVRRETEAAVSRTLAAHAEAMTDSIRAEVESVLDQARKAAEQLAGLDVTDASAVASATDEQRAALVSLSALSARCNRARKLQRDVLVATGDPVGQTDHSPSTFGWRDSLALGIHEHRKANLADHGPAPDLPPVARLLAVVARGDAWVPSREDLAARWDELVNPRKKKTTREDEQREEAQAARPKVSDRRATAAASAPA